MSVLAGLVPVFLLLALGFGARQWGLVDRSAAAGLNRLVANLALPAFLLLKVGTSPLAVNFSARVTVVTTTAALLLTVVMTAVAVLWKLPRDQRGVLAQAAMRGNVAFVAFPIILAGVGEPGLRMAVVTAAVLIPVMNLLAVLALEAARGEGEPIGRIAFRVVVNPMVLGATAGWALAALHWQPWPWLGSTLGILADFSLPAALLALGAQLELRRWAPVWRQTAVVTAAKIAVLPALGWWALRAAGASRLELAVGVLLLAAPTAVASYPVAAELGGDTDFAGACVLVTTVASVVGYVVWALVLG